MYGFFYYYCLFVHFEKGNICLIIAFACVYALHIERKSLVNDSSFFFQKHDLCNLSAQFGSADLYIL